MTTTTLPSLNDLLGTFTRPNLTTLNVCTGVFVRSSGLTALWVRLFVCKSNVTLLTPCTQVTTLGLRPIAACCAIFALIGSGNSGVSFLGFGPGVGSGFGLGAGGFGPGLGFGLGLPGGFLALGFAGTSGLVGAGAGASAFAGTTTGAGASAFAGVRPGVKFVSVDGFRVVVVVVDGFSSVFVPAPGFRFVVVVGFNFDVVVLAVASVLADPGEIVDFVSGSPTPEPNSLKSNPSAASGFENMLRVLMTRFLSNPPSLVGAGFVGVPGLPTPV